VEKRIPAAAVISKVVEGRPAAEAAVKVAVNPAAVRLAARVVSVGFERIVDYDR
jgi:hypothetical protein